MAFTLGFHIILGPRSGWRWPAMMLIANYLGLEAWRRRRAWRLARRWSKAVAVTFAVGAVTGDRPLLRVRLLWPAFTGRFGPVFGILFAIEGIFFFLEAIFMAIFIGLEHPAARPPATRRPPIHVFLAFTGGGVPPGQGHAATEQRGLRRLEVIFNPAVPYEVPHMILAAYLVTGFHRAEDLRGRHAARPA